MLSTLRKRRLERGLKVKELAEATGYSATLVSGVELLQVRPGERFRCAASDALDIAREDLFPEWDALDARARHNRFDASAVPVT